MILSKNTPGARVDNEISFICSKDAVANNYATNYYYIETVETVQVRYYVTPQGVDNARPVCIKTVSVPVKTMNDEELWNERKIDYEPDLGNAARFPEYQYAGYTFKQWSDYEPTGDGYYESYAVYEKGEEITFLARSPIDASAAWQTVIKVTKDAEGHFDEPNLNDAKYSEWHFDGYTFVNWTYDGNMAYANFAAESCTVNFVDIKNTGQGMVSIKITPGTRVDEKDIPEPADLAHFIGWESDESVDVSIKDRIYGDVTFYARYSDVTSPSSRPSISPSIDPNATPSANPNATPSANPNASATPSANPNGSASPSASASASPSTSPEVTKYTVSVSGGSGSGSYAAGEIVVINAYYMGDGQLFDKWTTSTAGVGFANPNATSTTFTMPAANVAITATYKTGSAGTAATNGSGGGNGSGGTGTVNSNNGTIVEITKPGISNTNLAGATVSGATDNFIVKVTEDQAATDAVIAALQARYGDIGRIVYFPMDISLYDSTGRTKIADTTGITVNLTLPLPDELMQYAGNNKVAAVSNGVLEDLGVRFTTVGGVPCVNFTATHFSPYVIYVDTANLTEATIDTTPKTGDPIHPKWFLALGLASVSLILFFKRDRKVVINTKTA